MLVVKLFHGRAKPRIQHMGFDVTPAPFLGTNLPQCHSVYLQMCVSIGRNLSYFLFAAAVPNRASPAKPDSPTEATSANHVEVRPGFAVLVYRESIGVVIEPSK